MTSKLINNKNALKIIKLLINESYSKEFIMNNLNVGSSTFYKQLSLIKEAGFKIKKENNIYKLCLFENLFDMAKYELGIISYLLLIVYTILPKNKMQIFKNAIDKMLLMTNSNAVSEIEKKYETFKLASIGECYIKKITILKKYLNNKEFVVITNKDSNQIRILPIEFVWEKNTISLAYQDEKNDIKHISLDNIIEIIENKKEIKPFDANETFFELYGKLAKSYLLKDGERIVDFNNDKIVVANSTQNKDELFRRLLRYDIFCKVTFPKKDAIKFKNLLEKSLANLEGILDNI